MLERFRAFVQAIASGSSLTRGYIMELRKGTFLFKGRTLQAIDSGISLGTRYIVENFSGGEYMKPSPKNERFRAFLPLLRGIR